MQAISHKVLACLMAVGLLCAACEAPPPPVLEYPGVSRVNPPGWPALDGPIWSPDGSKLATTNFTAHGSTILTAHVYVLDVATGELRLIEEARRGGFRWAESWSSDGDEIAFYASGDLREGIWVMNVDGQRELRFLSDGFAAAWSPDGRQMAVANLVRDEETNLWIRSIRILDLSTGDEQDVFSVTGEDTAGGDSSWSPDGTRLAFVLGAGERGEQVIVERNVYVLDITTGDVAQLTHGGVHSSPTWSPNGDLIAYTAGPSVRDQRLTITRADGTCAVQPLDITDVSSPAWSPDGKQIAFEWWGGIYLLDIAAVLGEDFLRTGPVCP